VPAGGLDGPAAAGSSAELSHREGPAAARATASPDTAPGFDLYSPTAMTTLRGIDAHGDDLTAARAASEMAPGPGLDPLDAASLRGGLARSDDLAAARARTLAGGMAGGARHAAPTPGIVRGGVMPSVVAGRAAAGVIPRTPSGVATWLPDGRWAGPEDEEQGETETAGPVALKRQGDVRWRLARRRIAVAQLAARLAGWPRQVLAAALLVAAVVVALRPDTAPAGAAPAPVGIPVVVAARDLPAGTVVVLDDLRRIPLPAAAVAAGAARDPAGLLGRTVAGPVRRGEILTDGRFVGPGLAAGLGPQESSAVPLRLADAEAAALVRAGDRVDVLGAPVEAAGTGGREAVEVATGVRVLAVLRGDEATEGVVLVVAATPAVARRLAGAAARHRLTVAVRPP